VRELSWEGFLNVRDLGGLPLEDGGETAFGRVARSEWPGFLTERGWRELVAHGIRTIVDLRCPSEEPYAPNDGIRRVAVPIFEFDDPELAGLVRGMTRKSEYYAVWMDYCRPRMAAAVAAVADAPADGVLVHCHSGRDRTGIVSALLLSLAGVPDEAIEADYLASMPALVPRYEQELVEASDPAWRAALTHHHEIEAGMIRGALTAAGDVREYLLAGGATEAQLERARARLVP
jgi:protein-tyrosine phosphatase